jgi:hypothetical protein
LQTELWSGFLWTEIPCVLCHTQAHWCEECRTQPKLLLRTPDWIARGAVWVQHGKILTMAASHNLFDPLRVHKSVNPTWLHSWARHRALADPVPLGFTCLYPSTTPSHFTQVCSLSSY